MEAGNRKIRNRDIPLLQNVYFLMQDIVSLERRMQWQRDRMNNVSQHLSGMPGEGRTPRGLDAAFAALSALEEEHKERVIRYSRELKQAEATINAIENERMRTFVTMMYLDSIPGGEVRLRLNMTRRGFEMAREAVEQAEDMAHVQWRERHMQAAEEG